MPINTVIYHYVRNNENFEYSTHSRRISEFQSQIDFFIKNGDIIDPGNREQISYFLKSQSKYAFLLTFDDGYLDHLQCAEFLFFRNKKALFFPPQLSTKNKILDVNKIHIILGCKTISKEELLAIIKEKIFEKNLKIILDNQIISFEKYITSLKPTRFNVGTELIIKRLLQRDIADNQMRSLLIDELLFDLYKSKDISVNYLTTQNLKSMKEMGMRFGSHSCTHNWLGSLSPEQQNNEIKDSFNFLEKLDLINKNEIRYFCYPYGNFNNQTLKILNRNNVDFAFTLIPGESSTNNTIIDSNLKLKRWDTNDFWDKEKKCSCYP